MKGLYIHIPFCKTICSYCDFPKIIAKESIHQSYIQRLIEEIDSYKAELNDISTVYFGGGTPNAISISLLRKLFEKLADSIEAAEEVTIELNPELVNVELVQLLKEFKITRVSLGIQTLNPVSIELLNRHHTKENVISAVALLRAYGIENINADFIFGIPGTSIQDVKKDLSFFLSLELPHISYYSLILEDRTVLKHKIDHHMLSLLDDDNIADMYEYIVHELKNRGYHHYEISNFSKPGYESKHNMLYWNCEEYIGVGSGACGYLHHIRYQNHRVLAHYMQKYLEEREEISLEEEKKEFFLLGLRMIDGVSVSKYMEKFHTRPEEDFHLEKLIQLKLLEIDGDKIRICPDKIFVANLVFEEFVGD